MHGELRLLSIYISDRTKENLGECRVNDILRLLTVSRCSNLLIKSLLSTFSFLWSVVLKCLQISLAMGRSFLRQMFVSQNRSPCNFYIYQFFNSSEESFIWQCGTKENLDWGIFTFSYFSIIIPVQVNPRPVKGGQLGFVCCDLCDLSWYMVLVKKVFKQFGMHYCLR